MLNNSFDEEVFSKIKTNQEISSVEEILDHDEVIIKKVKPSAKGFITKKILIALPLIVLWVFFDLYFVILSSELIFKQNIFILYLIVFFMIQLMPIWVWGINFIKTLIEIHSLEYIITTKRLIIKKGVEAIDITSIKKEDILSKMIVRSKIDKAVKIGDLYINGKQNKIVLSYLSNPNEIEKLI
jgi:hypothetical protein